VANLGISLLSPPFQIFTMSEEWAQLRRSRHVAMFAAEVATALGAHLALKTVGASGSSYLLAHVNHLCKKAIFDFLRLINT
jgi:hypothetical protein